MGQMKVLVPFNDGEEIWLGMDTSGNRRKVFQTIDKRLVNLKRIAAGLTVFEPGKPLAWHNHPESKEVDIIIRRCGTLMDDSEDVPLKEGSGRLFQSVYFKT